MRKKVELIHQIRAMEAAPINRNKLVDFTETAGYRFLSEMSLAEVCLTVFISPLAYYCKYNTITQLFVFISTNCQLWLLVYASITNDPR